MLALLLIALDDPTPKPTDVKAGPLGGAVFVFLILSVVVISFFLVRQLRRAQSAKDAGVFGDEPVAGPEPESGPDAAPDAGFDAGPDAEPDSSVGADPVDRD